MLQLLQPDMPVLDLCCNDNVHEVIDLWTQDWPRPAQVIVTADTMQRSEALLACWEQRGRPAHIVPVQFDPQGVRAPLPMIRANQLECCRESGEPYSVVRMLEMARQAFR